MSASEQGEKHLSTSADQLLKQLMASRQDFSAWQEARWIPWTGVQTLEAYSEWLDKGYHGEMDYLARHLALKKDASLLLEGIQSLILVTKSYVPADEPHGVLPGLRLAAYARGRDYHDAFGEELKLMAAGLGESFPDARFRTGTDSLPILERDLARQAGLGWVGKNTCLIHPKQGSMFFIGVILSTLPISVEAAELPDFCGTCTRCLDICPTQAFEAPRVLNATKCISYWTIESKEVAPVELSSRFGDWFFGCDLCQTVCPWNQKPLRGESVLSVEPLRTFTEQPRFRNLEISELRWILTADDVELRATLKTTPLARAKPFGLRRNALVVIENAGYAELADAVSNWTSDQKLGELATRVLKQIGLNAATPP